MVRYFYYCENAGSGVLGNDSAESKIWHFSCRYPSRRIPWCILLALHHPYGQHTFAIGNCVYRTPADRVTTCHVLRKPWNTTGAPSQPPPRKQVQTMGETICVKIVTALHALGGWSVLSFRRTRVIQYTPDWYWCRMARNKSGKLASFTSWLDPYHHRKELKTLTLNTHA